MWFLDFPGEGEVRVGGRIVLRSSLQKMWCLIGF